MHSPLPPIGLLDFCLEDNGNTHQDQLSAALYAAQHAEEQGCCSIWYGEHHQGAFQAAPLMMAALALGHTSTISVGTGGILASYYSPLEVANATALLACAYPGRVELGLARGNPDSLRRELLWNKRTGDPTPEHFAQQVRTIRELLTAKSLPAVRSVPDSTPQDVWLLGMSSFSATLAGELGTGYCHAAFLRGSTAPAEALQVYQQRLHACHPTAMPMTALALAVASDEHGGNPCHNRLQHYSFLTANLILPPAVLAEKLAAVAVQHHIDRLVLLQAERSYVHRVATVEAVMGYWGQL